MALALRFDGLLRERRGGRATPSWRGWGTSRRARVTQIMNLLNLAPDIQEAILFLPLVTRGRDPLLPGRTPFRNPSPEALPGRPWPGTAGVRNGTGPTASARRYASTPGEALRPVGTVVKRTPFGAEARTLGRRGLGKYTS